jgi:hypothetical protein
MTLTMDASQYYLVEECEKVHRMRGTIYRVPFDLYFTVTGSEFVVELVIKGAVVGSGTAKL